MSAKKDRAVSTENGKTIGKSIGRASSAMVLGSIGPALQGRRELTDEENRERELHVRENTRSLIRAFGYDNAGTRRLDPELSRPHSGS